MTKKNTATSLGREAPQKAIRGRLMARIASASAIGVQLLPNTEQLHEGLQLAAVLLLATDVAIDLLGGLYAFVCQAGRYVRGAKAVWRRGADGSVFVGVKVRQAVVAPRMVLRLTGRVTSSLLAFFSGELERWHLLLLTAALVIVVVDSLVEVAKVAGESVRRRLG
ncbi:hypothetical protein ACFY94_07720 [Streptomyces griseorubiginosus]|uniref:hypothetical protein n=1 Tax=Streptomyces griseorubiginosus TaxID=67304 RepID=UPI0036F09E45